VFMKKYINVILIVLSVLTLDMGIISLVTRLYVHSLAIADSGFDFDYDYDYGGGSSGGGSWGGGSSGGGYGGGSSSSSGSGGTSLSPEQVPIFLGVLAGIIAIAILTAVIATKVSKNRAKRIAIKKRRLEIEGRYGLPKYRGVESPIIQEAFASYVKIQNAWTTRNLAPVRHLLSDEIYNMYQMQLNTLIAAKQINIMADMQLYSARILTNTTSTGIEELKVLMTVSLRDYIVQEKSGNVVKGDSRKKIACVYELTFVRDANEVKQQNCPECGAIVANQMSTECPYCGSKLLAKANHYTLVNKEILAQYLL